MEIKEKNSSIKLSQSLTFLLFAYKCTKQSREAFFEKLIRIDEVHIR
jgi:hypothetical protein